MIGVGVETVGTDAGAAHSFDPAFPCHSYLMGNDKYGLTQLQNLARLPADRRARDRRSAADRHRVGRAGPGARAGRTAVNVAQAVGETVVAPGRRPRVRRGRVGQLPRHQRDGRARRPLRRRPARGRRRDDGRRLRPDRGLGGRGDGPPGLRPHQRDDRHHRGGQEPHPAARPRRRGDRAALELLRRPGRAGPRGGRGARSASRPATARWRRRPRRSLWHATSGVPSCSTCRWTCRPRRRPVGRRPCSGSHLPRRHRTPTTWPRLRRPSSGPGARSSWPGEVPGAARAPLEGVAERYGALLATSAVARGLFRRQPLVARRLRRLRLAPGGRADRGRRPDRRLGLRAEHVDHAARRADRRGRDRGAGRRHARCPRRTPDIAARRRRRRRGDGGRRCSTWPAPPGPAFATAPTSCGERIAAGVRWRDVAVRGRQQRRSASTRGPCPSPSTTCCRQSGWSRSTRATSWATRACTCPCPTSAASASPRPSSRSAWAWPPRSAPRSPSPTGSRSRRSATAER